MRPFVAPPIDPLELKQFAEDVEYYLSLQPRQLPSRYLYDPLGSALFDAICELPWYRITRAERRLLEDYADDVFALVEPLSTIVELGPGSGEKLALLAGAAPPTRRFAVHLVDVSASALDRAEHAISAHPGVTVVPHQTSYEAGLVEVTRARRAPGHTLTLFLGSNIGNFDPPGADEFLSRIRASLLKGDALLIGADLVKPRRDLLLAYDDPLGVTAAFNRNLLVRINRELGGDFDIDAFAHRAVWNARASRVEMHLVSAERQRVAVTAARLDVVFEAGETIWTESSYKYRPAAVVDMLERAGFRLKEQWLDDEDAFALTLAEAA